MGKLTHTVKGPIASFRSADKADIESLKLHFLPKQEGSGDTSPTNIRPITGWTGCNLFKAKKNLIDVSDSNIIYSVLEQTNGTFINTNTDTRDDVQIYLEGYKIKNGNYTLLTQFRVSSGITSTGHIALSFTVPSSCEDITHFCIKHNGRARDFRVYFPVKLPVGASLCCSFDITGADVKTVGGFSFNNVQLQVGSESALESYEGSTIPLSWSDHGAEYGGYVDPVKGELVAEWIKYICTGNENLTKWYLYGSSDNIAAKFPRNLCSGYYSDGAKYAMCNLENSVSNIQMYYGYTTHGICISNGGYVTIQVDGITTLDAMSEWLEENKPEIIFKTDSPIHYQLTPQEIQTFLDYNNFWSDTNDDTEVEYCFADRLSERKLIMDTPHIASASGAVASFSTDMKAPVKELKVHFTPVQEGSGDPSPENERPIHGWTGINLFETGINLFNVGVSEKDPDNTSYSNSSKRIFTPFTYCKGASYSNYFNKDNVTTFVKNGNGFQLLSRAGYGVGFAFPLKAGATYRCRFTKSNGGIVDVAFYAKDGTYLGYQNSVENTAVTVPSDAEISVFVFRSTNADTTATLTNLYLCKDGDMSSYEDHIDELVFPIKFPATKNLFNAFNYGEKYGRGFSVEEGSWHFDDVMTDNTAKVSNTDVFPAGTYTLSAKISGTGIEKFRMVCSSSSCGGTWNNYYQGYFIDPANGENKITFTSTEEFAIELVFVISSGHSREPGTIYNIQLERGSIATAYEPYGTVYGGYVDLIRGKLVATHAKLHFDGSSDEAWWIYDVGTYTGFGLNGLSEIMKSGTRHKGWSNWLKVDTQTEVNQNNKFRCWLGVGNAFIYCVNVSDILSENTLNSWLAYLATNPLDIVIPLVAPIEYDLTPQQIKTLKGLNNIWSDANGNVDVKYWTH